LYLDPARPGAVSPSERLRFGLSLLQGELGGRTDWWIFNHVGIARTQRVIPRRLRRPYAVFLNGIEVWSPQLSRDRLSTLAEATLRISISHHTARRVRAAHPEIGAIEPCPLGLLDEEPASGEPDAELLARIRPESVLIVGRMSSAERYKGHDELLECWRTVIGKFAEAQLVIVGGGDDSQRLAAKASELGLAGSVLFTGFVGDSTLAEIWKRVRVFAMPSTGEGFGLVYLQAMRASLPCIGSTQDAAGDIIVNEQTGFLVDRAVTGQLSSSIIRLLENPDLGKRMGAAGKNRFDAEFTYGRYLARLGPILQSGFMKS